MRFLLALPLLALAPSAAAAQNQDCGDLQTQTEMNICAGSRFEAADKRLNELYTQVRERLANAAERQTLLRDAQRSWVAFRDGECAFQTSAVEGGSVRPMIEADCRTDLTTKRVADFETYLACPEGDIACPVPAN